MSLLSGRRLYEKSLEEASWVEIDLSANDDRPSAVITAFLRDVAQGIILERTRPARVCDAAFFGPPALPDIARGVGMLVVDGSALYEQSMKLTEEQRTIPKPTDLGSTIMVRDQDGHRVTRGVENTDIGNYL